MTWPIRYALALVALGSVPPASRPDARQVFEIGTAALLGRGLARRAGRVLRLTKEGERVYTAVLVGWGVSP